MATFFEEVILAGRKAPEMAPLAGDIPPAYLVMLASDTAGQWGTKPYSEFVALVNQVLGDPATPSTNPGTPTFPKIRFATTAGTYTNFRSLRTGTITANTSSPSVVGVGTLFTTEISIGDIIYSGTNLGTVLSITDNTHLTLTANSAATVNAATFSKPGIVGANDGLVWFQFNPTTGYWVKNTVLIDLTLYYSKLALDPKLLIIDKQFNNSITLNSPVYESDFGVTNKTWVKASSISARGLTGSIDITWATVKATLIAAGQVFETSPTGRVDCLKMNHLDSLVWNLTTNDIAVVSRTNRTGNYYTILEVNNGSPSAGSAFLAWNKQQAANGTFASKAFNGSITATRLRVGEVDPDFTTDPGDDDSNTDNDTYLKFNKIKVRGTFDGGDKDYTWDQVKASIISYNNTFVFEDSPQGYTDAIRVPRLWALCYDQTAMAFSMQRRINRFSQYVVLAEVDRGDIIQGEFLRDYTDQRVAAIETKLARNTTDGLSYAGERVSLKQLQQVQLTTIFYFSSYGVNQSIAYSSGLLYVADDMSDTLPGYATIAVYNYAQQIVKKTITVATGHSSDMSFHKGLNKLFVSNANGSIPGFIYRVDVDAGSIEHTYDLATVTKAENGALCSLDESTNRMWLTSTVGSDWWITPVNITTGVADYTKQFSVVKGFTGQGSVFNDGKLYILTSKSTGTPPYYDGYLEVIDTVAKTKTGQILIIENVREMEGIDIVYDDTAIPYFLIALADNAVVKVDM